MGSFAYSAKGFRYVEETDVMAISHGDCKYDGEFLAPAVTRKKLSGGSLAGSFQKVSVEVYARLLAMQMAAGIVIKLRPLPEFKSLEEAESFFKSTSQEIREGYDYKITYIEMIGYDGDWPYMAPVVETEKGTVWL